MSCFLYIFILWNTGCTKSLQQSNVLQETEENVYVHPDQEERLRIFDRLVEVTSQVHYFTPQTFENLGFTWEETLPQLRMKFETAESTRRVRKLMRKRMEREGY